MKVNRITLWSVDLASHETYYMAEGKPVLLLKLTCYVWKPMLV